MVKNKSLADWKLEYEDMKFKKLPVIKTIKTRVNRVKNSKKTTRKTTKAQREILQNQRKRVIMGVGLLMVVVSITYSTYVVRTFVNGGESLIILAPQVVFAATTLVKAFSKLYN